jgi:ribosomal protein L40E
MATEMVCGECGATNQAGEDFCGECGSYLEWDARPVAVEPDPQAEAAPAEEVPRATLVDRVKAAVGIENEQPADPAEASPTATAATEAATAPSSKQPSTDLPAATVPAARHGDSASGPTQPTAVPVTAVRPGTAAPKARKRRAAPLDQPLQPGDLVCGSCGAGNKATRKYCRRCGKDLSEAEVAKIPWWRRLAARRQRTTAAGTRPRQRRQRRLPRVGRYLAVLLVLAAIVFFTKPLWSPAYQAVLDRVKGVEPVQPVAFDASSSLRGHRPGAIRDGHANVFWSPARPGHARGQYVEASFSSPVRLVYLNISSGAGSKEGPFLANGRPTRLRATVFTTGGHVESLKTYKLVDEVGAQRVRVARSDVKRIRLTIIQSHLGKRPGAPIALGEVEFYQRK